MSKISAHTIGPVRRLAVAVRSGGRRVSHRLAVATHHGQLGPSRELELRDFLPRR